MRLYGHYYYYTPEHHPPMENQLGHPEHPGRHLESIEGIGPA